MVDVFIFTVDNIVCWYVIYGMRIAKTEEKEHEGESTMFRILHLSDIHIGKTYKEPDSIACKIGADLAYNGLSAINCIVVIGDIFDGQVKTTDALIDTAVNFFVTLLDEINSNQEKCQISKEDVIFVPGNHDLIRVDDLKERWSKYQSFLERFYGNIPSFYSEKNYSLLKEYKEHKIAFIGFNSCEIEKRNPFDDNYINKFVKYMKESDLNKYGIDKTKVIELMRSEEKSEYDDYGSIPLSQITPIERKIKKLDDYIVVALFHHHFYLFPEVANQFGDSSLIRNYAEVIQHLRYMNVSVVLHGHKHFALERPFIMDDYYESADNIIDVFAGGSVGTARKEEHTFGVLDLYEKNDDIKLKHNKFVYNDESLQPIKKKQVPPQKLKGRVVKLLEILKNLEPEKFKFYEETAEKAFKSYDSCTKIISWVSEAITGFTDVYKYLDEDYNNILFLLYAINYRTICYMKIVGEEESYFESASQTWSDFYDQSLGQTDFMISKDDYHKMFMLKKYKDITSCCDKLLNTCDNKKSQVYLAFTMLGMFFTDLYLVLTKYADDFKESIKYKVNIKIEENKFHENVPAPRIVVKSDADRRSAYIELLCNEATAHKMAVLFIKEFDLLINKFEDYFKIIGLKLYYLLPRIDKDSMKNTLDNYNFEAYIPTLIPLLTGDNIYSSKSVFARELIQNSIDAISVREAKDKSEFSKEISIELKVDKNRKKYFKITDSGTGMDRYKIERYFTSIGRSFYSGEEYEDLGISYKPISNFGIGFLSSFMVCREIDVKTKYYIENSEGLKLHIPNYDGCFFIELDKNTNIGTEIKLYMNSDINDKGIVDYIQNVMQDIKYAINIRYLNEKEEEKQKHIPAHAVRRKHESEEFKFFVPFSENGDVGMANYENEIRNNAYIDKYEYGILICRKKNLNTVNEDMILNSGIIVERASLSEIFGENMRISKYIFNSYERERAYNDIIVNFPSNWLQLDVARDNITDFSDIINDNGGADLLGEKIAESLYKQIVQYIQYTKERKTNIPAIFLQDVIQCALDFCGNQSLNKVLCTNLDALRYVVAVEFTEDGLVYKIIRRKARGKRIKIRYVEENAKKERNKWIGHLRRHEIKINYPLEENANHHNIQASKKTLMRLIEETAHRNVMYTYTIDGRTRYEIERLIKEIVGELQMEDDRKFIFKVLSVMLLNMTDKVIGNSYKKEPGVVFALKSALLQYFCIGQEEKQEMRIMYDELREVRELFNE